MRLSLRLVPVLAILTLTTLAIPASAEPPAMPRASARNNSKYQVTGKVTISYTDSGTGASRDVVLDLNLAPGGYMERAFPSRIVHPPNNLGRPAINAVGTSQVRVNGVPVSGWYGTIDLATSTKDSGVFRLPNYTDVGFTVNATRGSSSATEADYCDIVFN